MARIIAYRVIGLSAHGADKPFIRLSGYRVIEVMGLMGDSSDHIPGVAGVGPKTAADLIQKFGSIKSLYERIDEVEKKKVKEKLLRDKEDAL